MLSIFQKYQYIVVDIDVSPNTRFIDHMSISVVKKHEKKNKIGKTWNYKFIY